MLIITVLCILISSLLSIIIVNGIIRNLKKVDGKINELVTSNGDLTQTIEITSGDEMELIAHHVNELLHYIREIMLNISDGSHTLQSSTQNVAEKLSLAEDDISNVSATMEEMSAAMEQTTASLSQMTGEVEKVFTFILEINKQMSQGKEKTQDISDKADQISAEAVSAKGEVQIQIDSMVEQMNQKIEQSREVRQITDLTGKIIAITQQTNLLSLNASIEAARAGEAGKGFAVVADEIGKLAANSGTLAKQINNISDEVIRAVEELAEEAARMIEFMGKTAMSGYDNLVDSSTEYKNGTMQITGMMQTFVSQSSELQENMMRLKEMIGAIDTAVEESTKGIVTATEHTADLAENTRMIKEEADENQQVSESLEVEVNKFKLK
jgi:methyl-accepting chemotaxis protein